MDLHLGTLDFVPITEHPELVAAPVAAALSAWPRAAEAGVAPIDPSYSDTAAFCEAYGVEAAQSANCVIVEGKRGEERMLAACVLLATTRLDVNKKVCELLRAKKASFAPMEKAVAESGMEFGAITPIGLPAAWPVYVDRAVTEAGNVIIGSGIRTSKIGLPGAAFADLPGVQVVEGLANPRE